MKNTVSMIAAAVALLLSSCEKMDLGCKKKNDCDLIPAKIVRYDCDRVIFQLLSDENLGDANWTDIQTGQSYSNVVSYYNTCKIGELTNGEITTLYVKIKKTGSEPPIPCFQCLAISQNPPKTMTDFEKIEKLDCGDGDE